MATQVIQVDPQGMYADAVRRAGEVLNGGGVVAFPTETVYGLAARADRREAMAHLRNVKGRDADKAFTVHVPACEDAQHFVPDLPGLAARFMRKAWPGPLTLIVSVEDPASAPVMSGLNGSAAAAMYYDRTIGLRCPDDVIAQGLLRQAGGPVVAASANPSAAPAPTTGDEVLKLLDGRIHLLLDAGRTKYAKPSTIVRVTGAAYELVREGVYDAGIVERLSTLRILFVCTGNTCRSPMAERLAKRMIAERLGCSPSDLPKRGIVILSAGTAGGHGGASENALKVMARRGMDLSDHASSALSGDAVRQADYIFAMTRAHHETILRLVPATEDRVRLLLADADVRDPVGGSEDEYEECARMVERGLGERLKELTL